MKKFIVITTINEKTRALYEFEKLDGWHLVVVGDRKSVPIECSANLTFLSVEDQLDLGFALADRLPYNHYTRKNIGYLYAMREGADIIYDTDDDNIPYSHWGLPDFHCSTRIESEDDFVNIYRYFSDEFIWPRGFPLDLIHRRHRVETGPASPLKVGVWQGLADLDPDVDAIYRLVLNKPVTFERKPPVVLPPGKYCPFNSQNTSWTREAFPYLYLPATVSFRFTDILRGFIAQRLLWVDGMHLGFHEATVYQERNVHDFMKDFRDEVECYLNTRPVVEALNEMTLTGQAIDNLSSVYERLCTGGLVPAAERPVAEAWAADFKSVTG